LFVDPKDQLGSFNRLLAKTRQPEQPRFRGNPITQRSVQETIYLVAMWFRLCKGALLFDSTTNTLSLFESQRMTPVDRETAALLIGVTIKNLDDYTLQIRYGILLGFDFKRYQMCGIGLLRRFSAAAKEKLRE